MFSDHGLKFFSRGKLSIAIRMLALLLFSAASISAQVSAWGNGQQCQLGDTVCGQNRYLPYNIGQPEVTAITAGGSHTVFLKADGTLLAVGANYAGQLGVNPGSNVQFPIAVPGLTNIVAISAGSLHTLALKSDGTVWGWGDNQFGQLGDGTQNNHPTPFQLNLTNVVAIDAGYFHSLALTADGYVWYWGHNWTDAQDDTLTPIMVPSLSNVIAISAGGVGSMALKSDGTVWVWGDNLYGEVGDGTSFQTNGIQYVATPTQASISGVTQISLGGHHSMALKSDGTVWVWGINDLGEIGNGTLTRDFPFAIWVPTQANISGVVDIRATEYHNLARKSDGTIWAWGGNNFGQIGINGGGVDECGGCYPSPSQVGDVGQGNPVLGAGPTASFVAKPAVTTPAGSNIHLYGESVNITFDSVTSAGTTSYTAVDPNSIGLNAGGFTLLPVSPAYDVSTTAVYSGNVKVCVEVTTVFDEALFNSLALLHGEGPNLVDRTFSRDYSNREICAVTTSLSPLVLAEGGPGPTPTPTPSPSPSPSPSPTPPSNPGTLQFSNEFLLHESPGTEVITVTRTGGSDGAVSVNYAISDNTSIGGASCAPGVDFIEASGTLNWADGDTSDKTFPITLCQDNLFEGFSEKINFMLSNPAGGATLGALSSMTLAVKDNLPQIKITAQDGSFVEKHPEGNTGTTPFVFNISLSVPSTIPLEVGYITINGSANDSSDFQQASDVFFFAPGETVKTVTVLVNGDTTKEQDESFWIELFMWDPLQYDLTPVVGQILDDDNCSTGLAPKKETFDASGGPSSVVVTTGGGCHLTASSNVPWIVITSANTWYGNQTVTYTVAPNTGKQRKGEITIGDKNFTVHQKKE